MSDSWTRHSEDTRAKVAEKQDEKQDALHFLFGHVFEGPKRYFS